MLNQNVNKIKISGWVWPVKVSCVINSATYRVSPVFTVMCVSQKTGVCGVPDDRSPPTVDEGAQYVPAVHTDPQKWCNSTETLSTPSDESDPPSIHQTCSLNPAWNRLRHNNVNVSFLYYLLCLWNYKATVSFFKPTLWM